MSKKIITVHVGTPVLINESARYYSRTATPVDMTKPTVIVINDKETLEPESNLNDMLKTLNRYKSKYGKTYDDLHFDAETEHFCQYQNDCSCRPTFYLAGYRLETEIELQYRLRQERTQQDARDARERAEYEKLKAKFGDKA
jgi:hypothetical protein